MFKKAPGRSRGLAGVSDGVLTGRHPQLTGRIRPEDRQYTKKDQERHPFCCYQAECFAGGSTWMMLYSFKDGASYRPPRTRVDYVREAKATKCDCLNVTL